MENTNGDSPVDRPANRPGGQCQPAVRASAMRQVRTRTSPEQQETAILKAAAEQVALVGVGRLSLDVVARRAGVSRSTLYRRFPSREALLTELGRQTFDFAMAR